MMTINIFRYKTLKAKIIKIFYKQERTITLQRYEEDERHQSDPFMYRSSSLVDYDKSDSFGDKYIEYTICVYDYKILVEYAYNGKNNHKEFTIEKTHKLLKENSTIRVHIEKKNPDNVFIN